MSDPYLGLLMLCLIVVVIMLGFPTAFTLMGLGMAFGFFPFTTQATFGQTIKFSRSWFSARMGG